MQYSISLIKLHHGTLAGCYTFRGTVPANCLKKDGRPKIYRLRADALTDLANDAWYRKHKSEVTLQID